MAGAEFELWHETKGRAGLQTGGDGPDEMVTGDCTTGADGRCGAGAAFGSYDWRQRTAPAGYALHDDVVSGPHVLDASSPPSGLVVDVRNARDDYQGFIRVRARDAKTSRALHGAVFEVWREFNGTAGLQTEGSDPDPRLGPGCATDGAGRCEFGPLPSGRFYLRAAAVPEGYVVPTAEVTGPLILDGSSPDHRVEVTSHIPRYSSVQERAR
ncbi:SpaA isopeptide-forming pilin-related protein [Streptomyces sp. NPDC047023]|uniref:MSCRAMM family protein n=1 Tax=Streptomyces sp. NPDC047023 TaxID=3155139 RepID=UPI0033E9B600